MKRRIFLISLLALVSVSASFLVSSCKDDDEVNDSYSPGVYHYQLTIPNSDNEIAIVLDSISSSVKLITECPEWASATVIDSLVNGHQVLKITFMQSAPNTQNQGQIVVMSEKGDKVVLLLNQAFRYVNDINGSTEFMTNWQNQDSVYIYSGGASKYVRLPWSKGVSMTTLPLSICKDIKKEDGWEMAFSTLNLSSYEDGNYFALYNRYLGILRVFVYVSDPSTNGSEYSFSVWMGDTKCKNKYPFYHSLAYAIPCNHQNDVNRYANLLNDNNGSATFKEYASSYSNTSTLEKGWTAFDITASAYCPENENWADKDDEKMTIACRTKKMENISLSGAITAAITGNYSSAEAKESSAASSNNGISSFLDAASSFLSGNYVSGALGIAGWLKTKIESAGKEEESAEKTDVLGLVNTGISKTCSVMNVASSVLNSMFKNTDYPEETVVDSMPGKINLNLTGDISLSGYLESLTSNSVPTLSIGAGDMGKNSHFGQGVWNLSSDPVIYMVNDLMVGDNKRVSMTVINDTTYGYIGVENSHLRMVTFFDPSSIKLNINTKVFPNLSDVSVVCDYGVYLDERVGYTQKFLNLTNLKNRPTLKVVKSGENMTVYQTTSSDNKTKYLTLPHTQFYDFGDTTGRAVVEQTGSYFNHHFYGKPQEVGSGKRVMFSPQVYMPYSIETGGESKNSKVYNGMIPDFVVFVTVSFTAEENGNKKTYVFSQRFLPKIVEISSDDLKSKYQELETYANNCVAGNAINTLSNNSNVEVKHPGGSCAVQKNLSILKAILDSNN